MKSGDSRPEVPRERLFAATALLAVVAGWLAVVIATGMGAWLGRPRAWAPLTLTFTAALLAVTAAAAWALRPRVRPSLLSWAVATTSALALTAGAARRGGEWLVLLPALLLPALAAAAALPVLVRSLPRVLDGAAARRPARSLLWSLVVLLGVVQTARLGAFMVDPELVGASTAPFIPSSTEHQCLPAYLYAADLARRGRDVYDPGEYERFAYHPETVTTQLANMAPYMSLDDLHYPPPFLLLPRAALAFTSDFLTLRTLYFVLQAAAFLACGLLAARWIGGRKGLYAGLCFPLVWLSPNTMMALQFGQVHLLIYALAIGGMVLLEQRRYALGAPLVAFACLTKIFPALLVVYLLGRRSWRALAWVAGAGAVLVGLTWIALGPEVFASFLGSRLGRLENGDAYAYLESSPYQIAANQAVHGIVLKLAALGVPGMSHDLSHAVARVYSVALVALAWWVGHRGARAAATPLVLWVALLNLGAMRSPFAPGAYVVVGTLWLFSLLTDELRGRPWRVAALALTWLFVLGIPPLPSVALMMILSLPGQLAGLATAAWVLLRRPDATAPEVADVPRPAPPITASPAHG